MRHIIARAKNAITDMLFPPLCLTCENLLAPEERGGVICAACVRSIPLYDALSCPACKRRIPDNGLPCHPEAKYLLAAAAHYGNEKAHKLIWQFKYENWLSAGTPLGSLMANHLRKTGHDFSEYAVVPIPLHGGREWKRGFNQAAVIGARIAKEFFLPTMTGNLVREKETASQADQKDYAARETNIQGAFHAKRPEEFKGKNILLVDDVTTSGATLQEATRVLKQCGAKKIIAAVIARAH